MTIRLKDLEGNEHDFLNFYCECVRFPREIFYFIVGRYLDNSYNIQIATISGTPNVNEALDEIDRLENLLKNARNQHVDNQEGGSL